MTLLELSDAASVDGSRATPVVLCGTFRRDLHALRRDYEALEHSGCQVLSPRSLDFIHEEDGFVRTRDELGRSIGDIEGLHLEALRASEFVWLHAPEGYVGSSAALEIGVAHSAGVPVFCSEMPNDAVLASFTRLVHGPAEARAQVAVHLRTPSEPLEALQRYYLRVAKLRGFAEETPQDTMLLLTEEVGELARAIRQHVGLTRAGEAGNPAGELADVQLYLLHLANTIGVDLAEAVREKEQDNHRRYPPVLAA